MLKYMKKHIPDVRVNDTCSSHIHFDIGVFNNNPELLYSFMVLLAETEPILTRFFCGEFINLRSASSEWARPFNELFLKSVPSIRNFSSYKSLLESFYDISGSSYKVYAFDFFNIYYMRCGSTFENRIPNGTLVLEVIQNNIMVTGYLMKYIASGDYDYERGLHNIMQERSYNHLNDDDAFWVADLLPNDDFKLDFLSQYYKDGKITHSKTLVKSKRIFY